MTVSTAAATSALGGLRAPRTRSRTLLRFLRHHPLELRGLIIAIAWVLISVLAPYIAPYGPLEQKVVERLKGPNAKHWFGTDQLGRDVFSRVLYGGRLSLPAGIMVVFSAAIVGAIVGSLAGFIGGWVDEITMRLTEIFLSFPTIILAMAIAAALGPSLVNAIVAMAVVWWPNYARIVRALVLSVKQNEYVAAARAIGVPEYRVLTHTILPNCISSGIVLMTIDLGNAILVFAGLSFLGLGPAPTAAEWGRMVADGIEYFDAWWLTVFPGLAIFTVVVAANFIGDALRDLLDPQLRNSV
jgi:peptide/nickel transport system permease protein